VPRPAVQQVFNLFHPTDPSAARLEPLLSARFSMLPPINIPRYQKYPLGNGQPYHICKCPNFIHSVTAYFESNFAFMLSVETIQTNMQLFSDGLAAPPAAHLRRMSEASIQSSVSGLIDSLPLQTINTCKSEFLKSWNRA